MKVGIIGPAQVVHFKVIREVAANFNSLLPLLAYDA